MRGEELDSEHAVQIRYLVAFSAKNGGHPRSSRDGLFPENARVDWRRIALAVAAKWRTFETLRHSKFISSQRHAGTMYFGRHRVRISIASCRMAAPMKG